MLNGKLLTQIKFRQKKILKINTTQIVLNVVYLLYIRIKKLMNIGCILVCANVCDLFLIKKYLQTFCAKENYHKNHHENYIKIKLIY